VALLFQNSYFFRLCQHIAIPNWKVFLWTNFTVGLVLSLLEILQTFSPMRLPANLLFPSLSASSVEEPLSFVVDSFSVLGVIEDFIRALERTVLWTKNKRQDLKRTHFNKHYNIPLMSVPRATRLIKPNASQTRAPMQQFPTNCNNTCQLSTKSYYDLKSLLPW